MGERMKAETTVASGFREPNIRPLVAIVTPVYNGNPWLVRTLASVQAQTYPNLVHVVLLLGGRPLIGDASHPVEV